MIASRGCSILGSGTVSMRTSPVPCQQSAFISNLSGQVDLVDVGEFSNRSVSPRLDRDWRSASARVRKCRADWSEGRGISQPAVRCGYDLIIRSSGPVSVAWRAARTITRIVALARPLRRARISDAAQASLATGVGSSRRTDWTCANEVPTVFK